jgi:DNA-binding response OmpR family regulator
MRNKTILIVDDDPFVRLGTSLRLKANGYDTLFAGDASTTLQEAKEHQPDLIMLDLGLPGNDGFLVIEMLKAIPSLALIPIIVVSGRDIRANQVRAIEAGAKAFLQKPVDNAELLAVIRRALGFTLPEGGSNGRND